MKKETMRTRTAAIPFGQLRTLLICLGISGPLTLLASQAVVETQNSIDIEVTSCEIHISKEPFQISISNHHNDIVKLTELFSGGRNGPERSTDLVRWTGDGEKLNLIVSSSDGNYYTVNLCVNEDIIEIGAGPVDRGTRQKLGMRFDTEVSGNWYGGKVVDAHLWPLQQHEINVERFLASGNQTSPIWLTSKGLGIISETYSTMGYSFNVEGKGIFEIYAREAGSFQLKLVIGSDIRQAYGSIAGIFGKPSKVPPAVFFKYPQFNTWIEFLTKVNQKGVEEYTKSIRSNNFPAGIFMIDDKWTKKYGDFDFDPEKFPDPKKMVDALHRDSLIVALWVTPFVEQAAGNFRMASEKQYLVMNEEGDAPYFTRWWNGHAAIVDLSNPEAYDWFLGELRNLQKKYGIDGFKLDGGDATFLSNPHQTYGRVTPNEYADLYVGLGQHFRINEFKIGWLTQGMGLVQRLRDKGPNWTDVDGIRSIIPHAMTAGMIGYYFLCADMVGGGLDQGYLDKDYQFDEELFIRWTQVSALMPMMQFSLAPWKLKPESVAIIKKYADLHVSLGDYIYSLAEEAQTSNLPLVRPLFFEFPADETCFMIRDQFMLGNRFLVAPVLEKGAISRSIYLPRGTWMDYWTGKVYLGGRTIEYPAAIDVLPILVRAGQV